MFFRVYLVVLVALSVFCFYLFSSKKALEGRLAYKEAYIRTLNKKIIDKDLEKDSLKQRIEELNLAFQNYQKQLEDYKELIQRKDTLVAKLRKRREKIFKDRVVYKYINCEKKEKNEYPIEYFKDIVITDGNYSF